MWRSLFWKEWREQRWKAALNTLVIAAFCTIGLRTRVTSDQQILFVAWFLAAIKLPLFVSVGLIAAERSEGSARLLFSLPTSKWHVLAAKTLIGMVVVILPFIASIVIALAIAGGREDPINETVQLGFLGAWIGVQALIWYLAFGAGQPDEARAGLMCISAAVVWIFYALIGQLWDNDFWMVLLPFGRLFSLHSTDLLHIGIIYIFQTFIIIGLWFWALLSCNRNAEVM